MKKLLPFPVLLLSALLAGGTPASAQSIAGSWVKTSEILTHADGKTSNSFEKISKAMPCFAGIIYTFSAGGKISEDASGCSATMQKTIASMSQQSSWKQSGDQVTMDLSGAGAPTQHSLFHIRWTGNNEMVWTFVYAENPGTLNPTKAKQMTTTYHRRG